MLILLAFSTWAAELKRVDANYFSFHIPVDMVKTRSQGIDSHVGEYRNSRIRLGFDYGAYSDPLDYDKRLPEYQSSKLEVGGRKARIVTFRQAQAWFTAIHFPDVGKASGDRLKLTMVATCSSEEALQQARDIFTSIRFD